MICSVIERRRWRPPYQTGKTVHVHAKHYKHNEDGRTAPGVCGNGSVLLNHSGTSLRELEYTHTHTHTRLKHRGYGYVPPRFVGNVVRRMGTQQQRLKQFLHSFQREHIDCYHCFEKQHSIIRTDSERFWASMLTNFLPAFSA